MEILPCENSLRTELLGIVCAAFFAAGFGLSDMQLSQCITPLTVALGVVAAVFFKALSHIKGLRKLYALLPCAAAVLIVLFTRADFLGGCGEIANVLIGRWNDKYSDAMPLLSTQHNDIAFCAAVVFISAALADILTLIVRPWISVIICSAYAVPFLVSSSFSAVAVACFIIAVIVQDVVACEKTFDAKKAIWLTAVAVIVITVSLNIDTGDITPLDDLREDAKQTVERIRYGEDTLPKGDLSKAYLMNKGGGTVLEVSQSAARTLYLQGFVGADYKDGKWVELTRSHFRGENEGIEDWLDDENSTPVMQYSRYLQADGTGFEENTVTVKNIGADRRFVYLPYSAQNVDCSQQAKRDSSVMSKGVFGAREYTFTEQSDRYPGELLYPKDWVLDPESSAQQDYSDSEGVYRSFVYKSYLDLDDELAVNFKALFVDTFDTTEDVNVYNVTQHIHEVLEGSSYYSESPDQATEDEPMKEFLNGKAGNSAMYATAAVLAYRAFGIPARYAEGYYIDGTTVQDNVTAELTPKEAHAWAEVYMDGLGWIPVDVTPGYYYDAYSLMEMVQKPQNINKTAVLEDDPNQADPIQQKGRQQDGMGGVQQAVRNIAMVLLGIAALCIALVVIAGVFFEMRTAVLVTRFDKRYQQADEAQKQRLLCLSIPTLLKCAGIEMNLGWNAEETEKELRALYPQVYEGEYIKVNQLMEKCIYGEEVLPAHELRVLSMFTEKLGDRKHSVMKLKNKLRLRYWKPPH